MHVRVYRAREQLEERRSAGRDVRRALVAPLDQFAVDSLATIPIVTSLHLKDSRSTLGTKSVFGELLSWEICSRET